MDGDAVKDADDDDLLDELIVAQPQRRSSSLTSNTPDSEMIIKAEPHSSSSPPREHLKRPMSETHDTAGPSPKRQKTGNIIEDSDSELSDLGETPEPPSPMLRAMRHLQRKMECTCEGWCTCPMHSAFPDESPTHLSEYTLAKAQAEVPVSAVRSTIHLPQRVRGGFAYPSDEIAGICNAASEILAKLEKPKVRRV